MMSQPPHDLATRPGQHELSEYGYQYDKPARTTHASETMLQPAGTQGQQTGMGCPPARLRTNGATSLTGNSGRVR